MIKATKLVEDARLCVKSFKALYENYYPKSEEDAEGEEDSGNDN